MIGMLKDFLSGRDAKADGDLRIRVAAAALLVEQATLDGHMDGQERAHILSIVKGRFALSDQDAEELLAEARQQVAKSVQILGFTKSIKDNFDPAERVRMIEMLWEVAYADGLLHDYEANLVRRVAGLLFVSDQESGTARKRAMALLGMGDGLA